jgi:hypothetical protein
MSSDGMDDTEETEDKKDEGRNEQNLATCSDEASKEENTMDELNETDTKDENARDAVKKATNQAMPQESIATTRFRGWICGSR